MPTVRFTERYAQPRGIIFAFFRGPANVLAVAPDDLAVKLIEGPDVVSVGDRYAVQVRRFGLSRRIDTEVTHLDEPSLLIEQQTEGPFRAWRLERRFAEADGGTELTETITYETPGGLLGLTLTPAVVERELARAYDGRADRVTRRLAEASAAGRTPGGTSR